LHGPHVRICYLYIVAFKRCTNYL